MSKKPLPFSGYHQRKRPRIDEYLNLVGPGTPCGEYMRRFWHPVMKTADLGDLPKLLRHLGEDLVMFRDQSGRYGLVHKNCPHRRASLEFGILTDRGIRCCYHGWEFDIDGSVIRAPAESDDTSIRENVCLGAYPVREFGGLLFAYLGPPDKCPRFPIYDTFQIDGGELVPYEVSMPCNWLQIAENSVDPMHVVYLHTRVNLVQFTQKLGIHPLTDFRERPYGLFYTKARRMENAVWVSTNDIVFPNFTQAGSVYDSPDGSRPVYFGRNSFTRWVVPVDDSHTTILAFRHFNDRTERSSPELRTPEALEKIDIAELRKRPYEERQRNPGDYEAFIGQGEIAPSNMMHLADSDEGIVLYRKRLRQEIKNVENGGDPVQASEIFQRGAIPTYGSDTLILFPQTDDDLADVKSLQRKIGDIYIAADEYQGQKRYDFLEKALSPLNRNT